MAHTHAPPYPTIFNGDEQLIERERVGKREKKSKIGITSQKQKGGGEKLREKKSKSLAAQVAKSKKND